jgi:hypothetical protein
MVAVDQCPTFSWKAHTYTSLYFVHLVHVVCHHLHFLFVRLGIRRFRYRTVLFLVLVKRNLKLDDLAQMFSKLAIQVR